MGEDQVKSISGDVTLLYARPEHAAAAAAGPRNELCPHTQGTNYSVIPELSLNETQSVLLSDERTLCSDYPDPIFSKLTMIVNCHESHASRDKYKIGSCK